MYQYSEFDRQFVQLRAAQFRDQLDPLASRHAGRRRIQAAAPAERLVRAALRAHAARGRALWRNRQRPAARAGQDRARLRPQGRARRVQGQRGPGRSAHLARPLRPLHHAPNVQYNWIPLAALGRRDGPAGQREHARHPDQRQLHPQHHHRRAGRHRGGRSRRPAPVCRNHAPVEHAAPRVRLPAAQVQDRHHRRTRRPRRHRLARRGPAPAAQCGRRTGLPGARGRWHGPHAHHRQRDPRVPALEPDPELPRSRGARLQPLWPPRQHLQGPHQDPGEGRGPGLHRPGRSRIPRHRRERRRTAHHHPGRTRPRERVLRAARSSTATARAPTPRSPTS